MRLIFFPLKGTFPKREIKRYRPSSIFLSGIFFFPYQKFSPYGIVTLRNAVTAATSGARGDGASESGFPNPNPHSDSFLKAFFWGGVNNIFRNREVRISGAKCGHGALKIERGKLCKTASARRFGFGFRVLNPNPPNPNPTIHQWCCV